MPTAGVREPQRIQHIWLGIISSPQWTVSSICYFLEMSGARQELHMSERLLSRPDRYSAMTCRLGTLIASAFLGTAAFVVAISPTRSRRAPTEVLPALARGLLGEAKTDHPVYRRQPRLARRSQSAAGRRRL